MVNCSPSASEVDEVMSAWGAEVEVEVDGFGGVLILGGEGCWWRFYHLSPDCSEGGGGEEGAYIWTFG